MSTSETLSSAYFKSIPQIQFRTEIPSTNLLFMYFVKKIKEENALQVMFKQLIVPVNQKYIKKQKNVKKKISCFKL